MIAAPTSGSTCRLRPWRCRRPCADYASFVGSWSTAERQARSRSATDTVVFNLPDRRPDSRSRSARKPARQVPFSLGRRAATSLDRRSPRRRPISRQLVGRCSVAPVIRSPSWAAITARSTYVMLDDHELVAIYRDRDIVGLDRLTRERWRMEARLKSGIWVKALIRRCDIAAIGVAVRRAATPMPARS